MKPTFTCNILRELNAELKHTAHIDPQGHCASSWGSPQGSVIEHAKAYLFANISRKMQRETDIEGRGPCLTRFLETEAHNKVCNHRISTGEGLSNALILRIIRARGIIQSLIGSKPPVSVLENATFTNGASTSRTRSESFVELKYIPTWNNLNCTQSALPFFNLWTKFCCVAYSEAVEIGAILPVKINEHARWSSVPKETGLDRAIVISNDCNVALQRGVGIHLRSILKRIGIDLQDQSRNRELARLASIRGDLATHDAVDSSNRIVDECVRMLLPEQWYNYLYAISERTCILPSGDVHTLELFSSMGNGFTFELQSLLYLALAVASGRKSIGEAISSGLGVYGDDVIIETQYYDDFLALIRFFGMEQNTKKSFSSGIFRESCGGHYMFGTDVTPFFLREEFGNSPSVHYKFCNELVAWCNRLGILPPWRVIGRVISHLKPFQRNQVPRNFAHDEGFHFEHPDITPIRYVTKKGVTHVTFRSYSDVTKHVVLRSDCDLPWYLFCMWSGSVLDGRRHLIVTESRKIKKRSIPVGLAQVQRFRDAYGRPWIA